MSHHSLSCCQVVTSREEKGKQSRLIFQTQVADIVHCVEDTKYSVKVTSLTKEHPRAPATRCSIILIFPEEVCISEGDSIPWFSLLSPPPESESTVPLVDGRTRECSCCSSPLGSSVAFGNPFCGVKKTHYWEAPTTNGG